MFSNYPLAMTFLLLLMILALVGTGYLMRDGHSPIELNYDFDDEGDEVPEAEIME